MAPLAATHTCFLKNIGNAHARVDTSARVEVSPRLHGDFRPGQPRCKEKCKQTKITQVAGKKMKK
jgi:hypothetical protein